LQYFEFDPQNPGSLISVPAPVNASHDATYYTSLLVLPTGQVMFVDGSNFVEIYTPASTPVFNPSWAPTITSWPSNIAAGTIYQITGTQFNGLSGGSHFGDETQNATNYPLVRITNNSSGHVFYARTHDHSTMGVATGSLPVSTHFDVPSTIELGASTLQVVANGIASSAVPVTVYGSAPLGGVTSVSPNSGPTAGGTTVIIAGSDFATGATVTFGGTSAKVTALSSTSITAVTPSHAAGAVTVTVTNPGGASWSLVNGFTYQAPGPVITKVAPASGPVKGGTQVNISGKDFTSGAKVSFGGSAGVVSSVNSNSIHVTTPAHSSGEVNVVVTNADGQTATLANGFTYTGSPHKRR
jgi:hypothetical protein